MGAVVETAAVNQQAYRKPFTMCTGVASQALKALSLVSSSVYLDTYINTLGEDDFSCGFRGDVYLYLRTK